MIRSVTRVATISALLAVAACTDIKSTDIKTAGISANIGVTADGTGATTASAVLNVDNNATDFVQLSGNDTLAAKVGSKSSTLAQTSVLGIITYSAGFNGQDTAGTQYTVALTRSATDVSAPSSTCAIPQPFAITAPSGQTFSRGNADIVVTYSNSGQQDPVAWSIQGTCFNPATNTLSGDPGTFTISKGSLTVPQGSTVQNCQATLTVTRTRAGTLDPAYFGGSIKGVQERTLNFTSTP